MKYGFCSHGSISAFSVVGGVQPAGSAVPAAPASMNVRSSMPPPVVSVVETGFPALASGSVAEFGVARLPTSDQLFDPATSRYTRYFAAWHSAWNESVTLWPAVNAIGEDTDADDWSMSGESAPLNWSLSAYW